MSAVIRRLRCHGALVGGGRAGMACTGGATDERHRGRRLGLNGNEAEEQAGKQTAPVFKALRHVKARAIGMPKWPLSLRLGLCVPCV
jgi:hypothetical protein